MGKKPSIFLLLFLIALAAGCIGQLSDSAGKATADNQILQQVQRPLYDGLPAEIFSQLPPYPGGFSDIDSRVASLSNPAELPSVDENYYKQPEFYPTWETLGVQLFANPPADRMAIWGLGAYPADQTFALKAGEEIIAAAFFHSSWLVQTYQGIGLVADYDTSALDVTVENPELLLGPNWPAFDPGWAQKAVVKIGAKPSAKAGSYTIGIAATQPSAESEEKWRSAYGGRYVNAPSAAPDRPYVQFVVNVE